MIRKSYTVEVSETGDSILRELLAFHGEGELTLLSSGEQPDRVHYFHVCDCSASYNQDLTTKQITIFARTESQINSSKTYLEDILEQNLT